MSKHIKKTADKQFKKHESRHAGFWEALKAIYITQYKRLFLIIVFLTLFSVASVVHTYITTGDFTRRDVSLKGGISLTITTGYQDIAGLESFLNERFPESSISIRTIESKGSVTGIIIEASDINENGLIEAVQEKTGRLDKEHYSTETMGSSLGESFFKEMFIALLIAFVSMGIVFQLYFKNIYGTVAALLSSFLDIFITLGIMNMMGMRLTAGGIAAYLMLIGYSVDTSILLSTKLLKENPDDVNKALFNAMKTGLTMSAAGLGATIMAFALTNNIVLKQIMLILIVGLFIDLLTTWIGNVTFLRIYLEKKHGKA